MSRSENRASGSRWALQLTTVRGIPIRLHLSFALLMLFLLWRTATTSGLRAALVEQLLVVAVFGCVALHELGHAVAALRNGVAISDITLYPFGGMARMARRPPQGRIEVVIAVAGPLVNVAIAAVILAVSAGAVLNPGGSMGLRLLAVLFWANLILAGFNLLPAFPLDGGRILRGLLTPRLGWVRATVWAASVGQVVGGVLIVVGLTYDLWLAFGGLLILPAANAELRYALAVKQFSDRRVADIARTDLLPLTLDATVSEAVQLSVSNPLADFLVTERGRATAYLSAAKLWSRVRSDEPGNQPAAALAEPLADPIAADLPIEEAITRFELDGPEIAPVIGGSGDVIGIVVAGDLLRAAQLARRATER